MAALTAHAICEALGAGRPDCARAVRLGHGMVPCPAHADGSPSLHVTDQHGKVLLHCFAGCEQAAVIAALRRLGLWPAGEAEYGHPPVAKAAKPANADRPVAAIVARLWRAARPAPGTVAAAYLLSRGLAGPIPPCLRFLPALRHTPTGRTLPAMVAAVTVAGRPDLIALHRTYLRPDGTGKADVQPCKMALGAVRGGAVQLTPAGERLVIAEGIETALSVLQATGIPTWAALSASNIANVVLPPLPLARELIIAADADAAGLRAADASADRWASAGRRVRIAVPPARQDFNDVLRGAP